MLKKYPQIPFDHEAPKYRCCCHAVHAKSGAYAIAYFSAFMIISNLLLKIAGLTDTAWNWELLFLVVDSIAVMSLFYGLRKEHAAFLQPFVVLSIVTILFLLLLTIFFLSAVFQPSNSYAGEMIEMELKDKAQQYAELLSVQQKYVVPMISSIFTVCTFIVCVVHCWFMHVVVQCARYLRDLEPIKASMRLGYIVDDLDESEESQRAPTEKV